MRKAFLASLAVCAALLLAAEARAQGGPPAYGDSLNLDQAKKAVAATVAEAKKNNWFLAVTVVGPSGDMIYFERMDNTQFGSIAISIHKAKAAATFRRPTKAFADAIAAAPGNVALLSLDGIIASEGGIPILVGGKLVGAIGCSGATGAQDGQACTAGVNAMK